MLEYFILGRTNGSTPLTRGRSLVRESRPLPGATIAIRRSCASASQRPGLRPTTSKTRVAMACRSLPWSRDSVSQRLDRESARILVHRPGSRLGGPPAQKR